MTSCDPAPRDIWLAYVEFADHEGVGKVRPVVILDASGKGERHYREDNGVSKLRSRPLSSRSPTGNPADFVGPPGCKSSPLWRCVATSF